MDKRELPQWMSVMRLAADIHGIPFNPPTTSQHFALCVNWAATARLEGLVPKEKLRAGPQSRTDALMIAKTVHSPPPHHK
jgi:hypothetical protein